MSDDFGAVPVVGEHMVLHDGPVTLIPCQTRCGEPVALFLGSKDARDLARLLLVDPSDIPPQSDES